MRSCAIAASSGLPARLVHIGHGAGAHRRDSSRAQTRASATARIEWRALAAGDCSASGQRPCQHRHVDQQCDRAEEVEAHRARARRRGPRAEGTRRRRAPPGESTALPTLRGALDQAGRVCGRRQPAGLAPPAPRLRAGRLVPRPASTPRPAAGRTPTCALRRTHAHAARCTCRSADAVPSASRPGPHSLQDAGARIDLHHGIAASAVAKIRRSLVHRRDIAGRSPSRDATRATNAPGSPSCRRGNRAGTQPLAATGIPGDTHSAACQFVGRQRLEHVRGRARPSAPHDIQHDRPGRVCAAQSHQQSRQSLAIGHEPLGPLVQHEQGEARRAAPATTAGRPSSRRTADSSTARLHRARSPDSRACRARRRHDVRHPLPATASMFQTRGPRDAPVVERRQHVRLERPRHQSHARSRGPGCLVAPEAPSCWQRRHQPGRSPSRRRAPEPTRDAVGDAGTPGGSLPERSSGSERGSGGRTAYTSNHSCALTNPKSTQCASAGCHSRQRRAICSGHATRATSSSTRRSIHTRPPVARSSDVPSSSATKRDASNGGVCGACRSPVECKKRDDVVEAAWPRGRAAARTPLTHNEIAARPSRRTTRWKRWPAPGRCGRNFV